jgi:hypothetical protein
MRRKLATGFLLACLMPGSQSSDPPELRKAQEDAARVRQLVEAGALPRSAYAEAQLVLEEARDQAVLRSTLYGSLALQQLTEEQTEAMLAVAGSLVDRQHRELLKVRSLVREGVVPESRLAPYQEELARREATLALAQERAALFRELVEMVRLEEQLLQALEDAPEDVSHIAERFTGSGVLLRSQFRMIQLQFEREFREPLPISANGQTELHRSLGFDHEGRYDIALHPDSDEGSWLRELLMELQIPHSAFRGAVAGSSTGAHIHIGPPSDRLARTD